MPIQNELTVKQRNEFLNTLHGRFEKHRHRHSEMVWADIQSKLEKSAEKLWSLYEMERTGGEPDVVAHDKKIDQYLFVDCAAESPAGRRSLCFDREALDSRKENKPNGNALEMAAAMGVEVLTEQQYRELQKLEAVDNKTSSWIQTPVDIRQLGGALFADRRYNTVFVYHNGASSYYAARGFRASLRV